MSKLLFLPETHRAALALTNRLAVSVGYQLVVPSHNPQDAVGRPQLPGTGLKTNHGCGPKPAPPKENPLSFG
ncbi:MAG TPA: hypothetical protein VGE70_09745 [Burkholderiaceae bacterium]